MVVRSSLKFGVNAAIVVGYINLGKESETTHIIPVGCRNWFVKNF
jgi:hypothetical protein